MNEVEKTLVAIILNLKSKAMREVYPDANTGYRALAPNDVQEFKEVQGVFYSVLGNCHQAIYKGIEDGEFELVRSDDEGVTFLAWYEVEENEKSDGIRYAKSLSRKLKANIEIEF